MPHMRNDVVLAAHKLGRPRRRRTGQKIMQALSNATEDQREWYFNLHPGGRERFRTWLEREQRRGGF